MHKYPIAGGLSLARNVFRPMFGTPRFFLDAAGDGGGSAGGGTGAGSTGTQSQGTTQTGGTQTGAEFSPEQQAKIESLINQAFGKGASKAEKEQATRIQQLEAELAKLKGGKQDDKQGDQGAKSGYDQDDIKKLLEGVRGEYEPKLQEANKTIETLKSGQRNAALMAAAAKAKAVDPEVVAKLVGDAVGFDEEGRLVVLDANGQPRLNSKAEPMKVDEYVLSFLEDRPYLKQASNGGGAGSGTKGAGGGSQTFTRAQLADPAFYRANKDAIQQAAVEGRIVD